MAATAYLVWELNRSAVLDHIRVHQPVSRADLARMTGMQRSTITGIVDQLVEKHWVVEGATGQSHRGRPPTLLWLTGERLVIGVDVQGSCVTVGVADLSGKLVTHETVGISQDPETAIEQIVKQVQRGIEGYPGRKIEGVGISLSGRWSLRPHPCPCCSGLGGSAPDLMRRRIAEATGLYVASEYAPNACIIGAVLFDGLEGCENLAVVRVGDEIQVGLMSNGQIVRGLDGMAGNFGHISLDPDGAPCACGGHGCWDMLASNAAALRRYMGPNAVSGFNIGDLLGLAGRGEARATAAIAETALHLARGMRMIAAAYAPERIVVIGDLVACWHLVGPVLHKEIAAQMGTGVRHPQLIPRYEPDLALRGAVAVALLKHFGGWLRRFRKLDDQPSGPAVVVCREPKDRRIERALVPRRNPGRVPCAGTKKSRLSGPDQM